MDGFMMFSGSYQAMPSMAWICVRSTAAPAKSSKTLLVTLMMWRLMNSTPSRAPSS
ncbi:hypothetical protein ABD440_16795 [Chromobacterium piscinae]|uniref:hypothetical protein n=1 Tax=Chromobacterium piscinae TaxID=686831 RepID=UPI0031FCC0B3